MRARVARRVVADLRATPIARRPVRFVVVEARLSGVAAAAVAVAVAVAVKRAQLRE